MDITEKIDEYLNEGLGNVVKGAMDLRKEMKKITKKFKKQLKNINSMDKNDKNAFLIEFGDFIGTLMIKLRSKFDDTRLWMPIADEFADSVWNDIQKKYNLNNIDHNSYKKGLDNSGFNNFNR